jgi:predicted nucleic acid-binding protein
LIGVTALTRNMTLVTDDNDLAAVVREFGGTVESFAVFTTQ